MTGIAMLCGQLKWSKCGSGKQFNGVAASGFL
jgi:hypothetical protein